MLIELDAKYSVWQNILVNIDWDGTKEELEQYLEDHNGDISELNPEYDNCETLFETEELLTPAQNNGKPTWELKEFDF